MGSWPATIARSRRSWSRSASESSSVSRDRRSAVGLAVFAIAYLLGDLRYPLDTLATPGPGLFPLMAGLALLALAAWQFATAGSRARAPVQPASTTLQAVEPAAVGPPLVMVGILIVYAALFRLIGFFPTSVALVFVSSRLMGLGGWWRPATLALGVTAASHVVFVRWLGVPLP
ncbi:MAG: hypothetical protein DME08_23605 [Candidatus Rokuibacteriota bacterium]|nr:MAG: hypothetical protein DME08_23605 [Candidatus Rokubacteria bacterium]